MQASILSILLAGCASLLLPGCALIEHAERQLVFRPVAEEWRGYTPGRAGEEPFWIPVGDRGERLHAWWLASSAASAFPATIVFFHGSNVNLSGSMYRLGALRQAGFNVLAIDYRGFGRSSPALPSERSAYEDALAAWDWLAGSGRPLGRVVLYGHSLGGAIAAEVALRRPGAAVLVLESAPTSLAEITRLDAFLTQRFDLLDKVGRVGLPVIVLHGGQDRVVPPAMAQRLHEAVRGPKRLLMVEDAGHRFVGLRAGPALYRAIEELAALPRT